NMVLPDMYGHRISNVRIGLHKRLIQGCSGLIHKTYVIYGRRLVDLNRVVLAEKVDTTHLISIRKHKLFMSLCRITTFHSLVNNKRNKVSLKIGSKQNNFILRRKKQWVQKLVNNI